MTKRALVFGIIVLLFVLNGDTHAQETPLLTFARLISKRDRLDRKHLSVVGYFDANDVILVEKPGSQNKPIAIQLTGSRIREMKQKGAWKSGYVRIAGTFEYVGKPVADRSAISVPAGFRGGYLMQISHITEFTHLRMP